MPSTRRAQSGQAIPLLAVMITILVGFLGLAVDSGRSYLDRRTLQNSTDAAVLTTADYFQNGYSVSNAEQYAAQVFAKNLQIYGGYSASPSWCATPSGSGSCTVNVTYSGNPHTLTLGYTDRRNSGKGLVFTATGNDSLPLTFLQALKLGPNVSLSATAQTVVGDQSQNPAILVTGTSCAPQASLGVSGGETVTVVGAIYSDGGITVGGSSQVDVQGNVYATCSQSDPSGMNLSSGFSYYSPVGKLAVNYLGGVNSPYWPYYSSNSESWPSTNIETSPGNYSNNVSITGSNCTYLDPGIYNFPNGFKDNGGLISNELRPPDEPVYNNASQRAGSGNGYIQFWGNSSAGVSCAGQFSVGAVSVGGGSGITQGTWSVVLTSAREDAFNPTYPTGSSVYYPRNSAPSMCRTVTVNNSGNQGLQVAISNVPGAEWYNVYAYLGSCPTNSDYSRFGYIGSVCSGQGALSAAFHTFASVAGCPASSFVESNSGSCPYLPSWPAASAALTAGPGNNTNCGLGYTVSPVYSNSILTFTGGNGSVCPTTPAPSTPDYSGTSAVTQGCEPPDSEVCPSIVGGCATPGVTSPMPPNDPPAQWQGGSGTGDRADENECSDLNGSFTACPGNVTPGAVQFSFPNSNGACFDDEGNGGAWVFSGRQYDYIAVYSLVDTSTCSGANGNKIAGGGATSWIGTTYFPNAYLTISGSAKAPISGQVVASNLTIDGSAGVTVDYNPALAPVQAAGKIILYPCSGCP